MENFGKISIWFRWIARFVGGSTLLLFIVFAIGEGLPMFSTLSSNEKVLSICLIVALIGILVSWRWSLAGCLLILTGYVGFLIANKHFAIVNPFLLFPAIVAFYLLAWFFDRLKSKQLALHK